MRAQGAARVAQGHGALEAVEDLEVLDRVPLDARPEALPDDAVEVDEPAGAQQPVDLVLARRVPAHQPLERGRLVGRVVVDVHPGVGLPRRRDQVDDRLEGGPLLGVGERPEPAVDGRSGVVERHDAEQVLAPALAGERVALEVEEHVAGRRLREPRQPQARLDRPELDDGPRPARATRTAPAPARARGRTPRPSPAAA